MRNDAPVNSRGRQGGHTAVNKNRNLGRQRRKKLTAETRTPPGPPQGTNPPPTPGPPLDPSKTPPGPPLNALPLCLPILTPQVGAVCVCQKRDRTPTGHPQGTQWTPPRRGPGHPQEGSRTPWFLAFFPQKSHRTDALWGSLKKLDQVIYLY